jgi:hypothetical protein
MTEGESEGVDDDLREPARVDVAIRHPSLDEPMTLSQGIALDDDGTPIMGWDDAELVSTETVRHLLGGVQDTVDKDD